MEGRIYKEYYYIVDFRDITKPLLFPIYYLHKKLAQESIKINVRKRKQRLYKVLRGDKIFNAQIPFRHKIGKNFKRIKYLYPKDCFTDEERKNYRKRKRRALRRMGLYTTCVPSKYFDKEPQYVKLIKNKQERMNSPNSMAVVIQLDRKPNYYYYIILSKQLLDISGKIMRLQVIRIDMRKGLRKRIKLDIIRRDIIRPFLMIELYDKIKNLPNEKNGKLIRWWERKNLPIPERFNKQKNPIQSLI